MTLEMREGFFLRKKVEIPQIFTEYVRRDPAVLAALPEVQALIRQELTRITVRQGITYTTEEEI